jgi:ornithine carbamoyltransferase
LFHDATAAAHDVDLIVTDVWTSMGQEQEQEQEQARRLADFSGFQVDTQLVSAAGPDILVMHDN